MFMSQKINYCSNTYNSNNNKQKSQIIHNCSPFSNKNPIKKKTIVSITPLRKTHNLNFSATIYPITSTVKIILLKSYEYFAKLSFCFIFIKILYKKFLYLSNINYNINYKF